MRICVPALLSICFLSGAVHARTATWQSADGEWTQSAHWDIGVPDALTQAVIRGRSSVVMDSGRQVVGALSVGASRRDLVKLEIRGTDFVIRRGALTIGEEDGGSGEVVLQSGRLYAPGSTYVAAANAEPGRKCKGSLVIKSGTFVTRSLAMGWGPESEALLSIQGSKVEAIHVLEYLTMGVYTKQPPSVSTIRFHLDEHGVTPIAIEAPQGYLAMVRSSASNRCVLRIELDAIPPRGDIPLITAHGPTRGTFDDLPEGAEVRAQFGERTFVWTLTYHGGASGCDVVLTNVRGHAPEDILTSTRPLPPIPPYAWLGVPLRAPFPASFEPAFPGAEGFGAISVGGRGGREIAVTNLNDEGEGSLRAAVEAKGPRIITFRVGGEIRLSKILKIAEPFVSILGQTAPEGGITLRGRGLYVQSHDVILQHLRVRPGPVPMGDDAIGFYDTERCIVDHCSFTWGNDEVCSITGLSDAITIQHCLIGEGLNHAGHSMGGIAGGERSTWHHNLIAHCRTRNPRFAGVACCDFRNNVVYNWGDTAAYGEFERLNFVGNYFKPGPSTTQNPPRFHIGDTMVPPGTLFAEGNVLEGAEEATRENWKGIGFASSVIAKAPFAVPAVSSEAAAEAYAHVLQQAGATLPRRDAVDGRIIESVRSRTGEILEMEPSNASKPQN